LIQFNSKESVEKGVSVFVRKRKLERNEVQQQSVEVKLHCTIKKSRCSRREIHTQETAVKEGAKAHHLSSSHHHINNIEVVSQNAKERV
jgi:hypothetical protein